MKVDFYSDEGVQYWKRRMKELAHAEEETSKELARKARRAKKSEGVETESPRKGRKAVRVVRGKDVPERTPHNQSEVCPDESVGSERDGAMRPLPQVRGGNRSPRKPNKGSNVPEVCQTGSPQDA